ncbi:stalk domain-containing protein [Paenibacillus massiliensis]|uniref:stalk domain-containing protein n=1 Tax=Paenibacillus massiliensis TaxID=225917 RepID=UPI0003663E3B|nr:stalk domain-containing protein [Paenibacillus massiliensis]
MALQRGNTRWSGKRTIKNIAIVSIAGILWVSPVAGMTGVNPLIELSGSTVSAASAVKTGEEIITSGAILMKYKYKTSSGTALADVVRVDMNNPYVKLDVMTGKNGQFTTRQSTEGMAKETGAVAGINGDYFNTSREGAPIGGQVSDGELMSTPSDISGMYAFAAGKDNKLMIEQFTFEGTLTAQDGSSFPLSGINKVAYTPETSGSSYSHSNTMFIYTSAWKALERPTNSSTTPTEVLVENGVITQISENSALPVTVPEGGYILRTHGKAAEYVRQHLAVGQSVSTNYQLKIKSSGKLVDPSTLQTMIGGHTILVNEGKKSSFSRSVSSIGGTRARTALGYSKDQRYVYLIAVEKNNSSTGMSLSELQSFMVDIGVWKGLNLDGGGSTTMVTRPLGDTSAALTFDTEYGKQQRSIVNGLGVYTEAPKGTLKGFTVGGTRTLLIGQTGSYSLKGYDTYYNPYDVAATNVSWKSSNSDILATGGGVIKGVKPGTATLTATSGSASAAMKVTVMGAEEISSLTAGSGTGELKAGAAIAVPVTAKTTSGQSVQIAADALKWEFVGFKGSVKGDQLTVSSVDAGTQTGYAIGRYDGFSAVVVLTSGGSSGTWENFENVNYPIDFTTNAAGVTGSVSIVPGSGEKSSSKVLELQYDMTAGSGKMYAYAQLNGTSGKTITSGATGMTLDVMGDMSLNWLRAEVQDANGQTVYLDLAKVIDWEGWKTISVDLSGSGIAYPAKLKRLYVVNVEEGQDERAKTGTVAFDNITLNAPGAVGTAGLKTGTAQMSIGQRSMTVNGQQVSIDSAPIQRGGSTYVPIKYVLDAFGGQAQWNSSAQRITVIRGGVLIDLTVGQKKYVVNGKSKTTDVVPIVLDGRTLVPLRLVSEQLGLTVKWEQNTKTVTIQS